MSVESVLNQLPFVDHLGIEIVEATDGHAEATLELAPEHSSNPERMVAHGGVTYALADTVGGAAVISRSASVSPTIDMRIDYLAPATADLTATADVLRFGGAVAVADVEIRDVEERHVATARGVYKVGGQGTGTPWTDRAEHDSLDPTSLEAAAELLESAGNGGHEDRGDTGDDRGGTDEDVTAAGSGDDQP